MHETELLFFCATPRRRELQILMEIDRDPRVSQKLLAARVGLAPSMVNNYIKQLCEMQKVRKEGPNHKATTYHLTKEGRRIMESLFSEYLFEALALQRILSRDLRNRLRGIMDEGVSRVALQGAPASSQAIRAAARDVGLQVIDRPGNGSTAQAILVAGQEPEPAEGDAPSSLPVIRI